MKDQNNNNAKAAHTLDAAWSSKYGGFKKKGGKNNTLNSKANNFKGLGFHIGKDGSKIYEKTINKLALYISIQLKNGSDFIVCLWLEENVETELPIMPENPTDNGKQVWENKMSDYLKSEKVPKGNLHNLYTVVISPCDAEVKNQVKALERYMEFDKKLNSMTLLKEIKNIVYTSGCDNLHAKHNKAMVHISFMDLQQEKYQDIQDFRDQYMSVSKVCDELDLTFG